MSIAPKMSMVIKLRPEVVLGKTKAEVSKRLELVGAAVESEAKRLVSKSGNNGENTSAPGEAPRHQTGSLLQSIKYRVLTAALGVMIGPSVIYGKWLEFGTRRMAARPFMRPALMSVVTRMARVFERMF